SADGRPGLSAMALSDLRLLGDLQRIVHLYPEIADRALYFCVSEQQLDRAKIFRPPRSEPPWFVSVSAFRTDSHPVRWIPPMRGRGRRMTPAHQPSSCGRGTAQRTLLQ